MVAAAARLPHEPGTWLLQYVATFSWGSLRDLLTLQSVLQPLGGVQWLLRCSGCGMRRRSLFAPRGARVLQCRVCANLAYHCQRLAPFERLTTRAAKLARELGAPQPMNVVVSGSIPEKPRHMHWRTYEGRIAQLGAVVAQREQTFFEASVRHLDRISPNWRKSAVI